MINIFDLHNDYLTEIKGYKKQTAYLAKARKNGLAGVCSAVWTTTMNHYNVWNNLERARYFADQNNVLLSVEDLHFAKSSIEIERVIELNPAYVGLTWNDDNIMGSGANGFGGLTEFGETAVRTLEANNIQIDTAHMNEKTFLDFSRITERPMICSHSCASAVRDHKRNFKDYQIKIITETGGIFGLCLVPSFLTEEKTADLNNIVRHIDHLVNTFSIDHIALGTDFCGTRTLPRGVHGYKALSRVQNNLFALGYTQTDIQKLFFENANNFFCKEVMPISDFAIENPD